MSNDSMVFLCTLSYEHIGKRFIKVHGKQYNIGDVIGYVMGRDLGKKVYIRNDVLMVENDEQLRKRSKK